VQINHISFSSSGGAGIVAKNLAETQVKLGHKSNLIALTDTDLRSNPFKNPMLTASALADHWLAASRTEQTLFSPIRSRLEVLTQREVLSSQITHLHWIVGVLKPRTIRDLLETGRKVVWTLHDMNPLTGGCHHAHDCSAYERYCSECPQASPLFKKRVEVNLQRKILEKRFANLQIVAPTEWVAEMASRSIVFRNQNITVIPNPIASEYFSSSRDNKVGQSHRGETSGLTSVIIAKDLLDPNKNVQSAIRILEATSQQLGSMMTLLLIGSRGDKFTSSKIKIKWLGELSTGEVMKAVSTAHFAMSTAIAESAGMTVVEAAALGVPTIAMSNSGTSSFIESGLNGFLAKTETEFIQQVSRVYENREKLRDMGLMASKSSLSHKPELVAKKYLELYEAL
jgi:glycosyltransferase involved in cell wall biosynthesis